MSAPEEMPMIRRSVLLACAAVLTLTATTPAFAHQDAPSPAVAAALTAESRPAEDRARDDTRKAAETLAFTGVQPGWKVADMIIGGGYFTRLFSEVVGPGGSVTAWQPDEFIAFQASYGESLAQVDSERENVTGVHTPIGAPTFPGGLDLVFTAQNYHDLHLEPFADDTASKVNAAVFEALRPGGAYVIIDHHAVTGAGLGAAESVHRIDIDDVKREVLAAGFVLEAESDILSRPADPRTASVFDPSIRGATDQFMLRFRKPG
jgi:predicted methyltransferase